VANVTFDHVTKRFGDVTALNEVNLQVEDKEFLVMVGPSGCGKTTALRLLAGLEDATEGKIWIGDRVVNDVAPKDRDIAMVFQSYALYPHMTVFENIAFGLQLSKTPKEVIRRWVQETAEILGIETLLDRRPRHLSGGQRQRVAVGRAIVREPSVFLFDEPLSNLDAKLRVETRANIRRLHQRLRTTFIYVTHDQVEAMTMASRIAVIKSGILQQVDVPQRLYDHPGNAFVAGFIGSPAMNLLNARLEHDDSGLVINTEAFSLTVPATKTKAYERSLGKPVIFGIRPEDIHDPQFASQGIHAASVELKVEMTELMGNEVFLYLAAGPSSVVGRVDPRTNARPGAKTRVVMNMNNMHLFHAEGEQLTIE